MARRKPRKPKGVLAVPTPRLSSDNAGDIGRRFYVPKLYALFDRYGIPHQDENRWFLLATRLAAEYVPGFYPARPQGRKVSAKGAHRDSQLLLHLGLAELKGESVREVAGYLASGTRARGLFKGTSPKHLRNHYYRLKDPKSAEGKRIRNTIDLMRDGAINGEFDVHVRALDYILERGKSSAK